MEKARFFAGNAILQTVGAFSPKGWKPDESMISSFDDRPDWPTTVRKINQIAEAVF